LRCVAAFALLCAACERTAVESAAPQTTSKAVETASAENELARLRAQNDELELCVAKLRSELEHEHAERIAREQEWLRYTQGIDKLGQLAGVGTAPFASKFAAPVSVDPSAAAAELSAAPALDPTRAAELAADEEHVRLMLTRLRALFVIDQIDGLDLLELGQIHGGKAGPIVLRELDEGGRPMATLCAEHLHLEGSRAARTLTFVLEDGYERRGGRLHPFPIGGDAAISSADSADESLAPGADEHSARRGLRRIELAEVDPLPWIEAAPELFSGSTSEPASDDGKHPLGPLRAKLNQLLREDATHGWYRMGVLGGVQGVVLREVELDVFDKSGALERKLFADRLTVLRRAQGVELLLEQGAQMRGSRKTPFLDGRLRIILPRADPKLWSEGGVPMVEPAPLAAPLASPADSAAPSAKPGGG
jgi:hypothetical protein